MAEDKDQDQSQKTEEASQQHIEKARKKGQIALSREINHLLMFIAAGLVLIGLGPNCARHIAHHIQHLLLFNQYDILHIGPVLQTTLINIGTDLAGPALAFVIAALAAGLSQTQMLVSTESMKPKLSKLSPMQGLKRMLGPKSLMEFLKGLLKIVIVGVTSYYIVRPEFDKLLALPTYLMPALLRDLHGVVRLLLISIASIMVVVAIIDYLYQRFMYLRGLRMSRQDVRDEIKESTGDPHIRQRLRELRSQRARTRMMASVPKATVVITNPTHYAVALAYEHGVSQAPRVVAKGADLIALRIRELAQKSDVPLVENPPLARALFSHVDLNQEIPEKYYQAVAQVIRYIMGFEKQSSR